MGTAFYKLADVKPPDYSRLSDMGIVAGTTGLPLGISDAQRGSGG
jgi:hypothetical protein